jgi:hypothetical protein
LTSEDSRKQLRYWDLKQRIAIALQKGMPGISGAEILPELEALVRESEQVLRDGLPPFVEAKDLLYDMAQTEWCMGLLHSFLGERAALRYEESGNSGMARHCRQSIEDGHRRVTGNLDEEIRQLQAKLDQTQPGTLDRIAALLEIGKACLSAGDEFAAEEKLNDAEEEMQALGLRPPTAEELLEGVGKTFDPSRGAEEMAARFRHWDTLRRTHESYKAIYLTRSYLERKRNPVAARSFMDRFQELVRNEPGPEVLNGLLKTQQEALRRQRKDFQASLPAILQPGNMEAMFGELEQVLGKEAVQNQFGEDPVLELQEIDRLNEEIQKRWDELQEHQEFGLQFDLEEIWQKHARLVIENAGASTGSARDELMRRTEELETRARLAANPENLAGTLLLKGDLLATRRSDMEALAVLNEAEGLLTQVSRHDLRVFILRTQAEIHARQQDWQRVSELCEEGIRSVEQYRLQVTAPYLQSAYLRARISLYRLGVRSAYELRDWEKALERADLSKCRAVLGYSQLPHLHTRDLTGLEERLRGLTEKIHSANPQEAPLEDFEEERRDLWARVFMERTRERTRTDISRLDLRAIQESLEPEERRAGLERCVHSLSPRRPAQDLRGVWRDAAAPVEPEEASSFLPQIAELLLPDGEILKGKRQLLISPHSLLHSLPFHALPWQGAPLLREFEVLYVPNLGSLAFQFEPAKRARPLLVGTCEFEPGVSPLAMTEQEVSSIAAIYQSRGIEPMMLIGEEAGASNLRAIGEEPGLEAFTCLHFAVHGSSVPEDFPMESKLFLRDASVDGMEISNWRLAADLVVLSACWSASRPFSGRGMDELPGDEMFGLQAAFFAAGARRVLGALWPVQDETAYQVMVQFHQHLAEGRPPETALRLAMLSLLDSSTGERELRDWAPFYIVALCHPSYL